MSDFKPLAIDLWVVGMPPAELAIHASAALKNEGRVEIETTDTGITLYTVSELDADLAIAKLENWLKRKLEHGGPRVLFREGPPLLEPLMGIEISIPTRNFGEVAGDFNSRRGALQAMTTENDETIIVAGLIPLIQTIGYYFDLRRLTNGQGVVRRIDFHSYQRVPPSDPGSDEGPDAA